MPETTRKNFMEDARRMPNADITQLLTYYSASKWAASLH